MTRTYYIMQNLVAAARLAFMDGRTASQETAIAMARRPCNYQDDSKIAIRRFFRNLPARFW